MSNSYTEWLKKEHPDCFDEQENDPGFFGAEQEELIKRLKDQEELICGDPWSDKIC